MTAPATIFHCSQLTWHADCPRRSYTRLIWREIEGMGHRLRKLPRGIGGIVGTSVHKGAEYSLNEKAQTGELPPASAATDAARDTLVEQLGLGETAFDATTPARADALRQIVSMTKAYHRIIAPQVNPIHVEERLEAEISPGLILSGKPDVIAREPHRVRDLKTGARPGGGHVPQIGGYSLLARSNGIDIAEAAIDFIQRVGANKPQPDPTSKAVAVALAETAASNIIRHIEGDLRTFREGDPERRILPGDPWAFMANPNSNLCGERYCSAWGTSFCNEWQK